MSLVRRSGSSGISKTGDNRDLSFDELWLFHRMTGEADVIHQFHIRNAVPEVVMIVETHKSWSMH
jgi:hypothetical protein